MKAFCPNCGHGVATFTYEPARQRVLPPLAPLPDKPMLNGSDPQLFGSWMHDMSVHLDPSWQRSRDLHAAFSKWWVSEGGAPLNIPSQRRMSIALVALGWVWKNTKEGRVYGPPQIPDGGDGS